MHTEEREIAGKLVVGIHYCIAQHGIFLVKASFLAIASPSMRSSAASCEGAESKVQPQAAAMPAARRALY